MKIHIIKGFTGINKALIIFIIALLGISLPSCQKMNDTSEGCVVSFIVGAERRNMARVWENLSPNAQAYYNAQGEKMRKSGRGALENEISRIEKFKTVKDDYTVQPDNSDKSIVNLVMSDGKIIKVYTEIIDGSYRIRDENSVKNVLEGITAAVKQGDGY